MPAGTSRWRAIQRGVIRAATVIGMTATSGTKPASGASSIEDLPEGELGQAAGDEQVSRPIRHGRSDSADV